MLPGILIMITMNAQKITTTTILIKKVFLKGYSQTFSHQHTLLHHIHITIIQVVAALMCGATGAAMTMTHIIITMSMATVHTAARQMAMYILILSHINLNILMPSIVIALADIAILTDI